MAGIKIKVMVVSAIVALVMVCCQNVKAQNLNTGNTQQRDVFLSGAARVPYRGNQNTLLGTQSAPTSSQSQRQLLRQQQINQLVSRTSGSGQGTSLRGQQGGRIQQQQPTRSSPRVIRISRQQIVQLQREQALRQKRLREQLLQQEQRNRQQRLQQQRRLQQQQQNQQQQQRGRTGSAQPGVEANQRIPSRLQLARVDRAGRLRPLNGAQREAFIAGGGKIAGQILQRESELLRNQPAMNQRISSAGSQRFPSSQNLNQERRQPVRNPNQFQPTGIRGFPQEPAPTGGQTLTLQQRQQIQQRQQQQKLQQQQQQQIRQQLEQQRLQEEQLRQQKLQQQQEQKLQQLQGQQQQQVLLQKQREQELLRQQMQLQKKEEEMRRLQLKQEEELRRQQLLLQQQAQPPEAPKQPTAVPSMPNMMNEVPTMAVPTAVPSNMDMMEPTGVMEPMGTPQPSDGVMTQTKIPFNEVTAAAFDVNTQTVDMATETGKPASAVNQVHLTDAQAANAPIDPIIAKRQRIHQLADLLGFKPIDLLNVVAEIEASKNALATGALTADVTQKVEPATATKVPAIVQDPTAGAVFGSPTKIDMSFVVGMQNAPTTESPLLPENIPMNDGATPLGEAAMSVMNNADPVLSSPTLFEALNTARPNTGMEPAAVNPSLNSVANAVVDVVNGGVTAQPETIINEVTPSQSFADLVTVAREMAAKSGGAGGPTLPNEAKINQLIRRMAADMLINRIALTKMGAASTGFDTSLASELVTLLGGTPVVVAAPSQTKATPIVTSAINPPAAQAIGAAVTSPVVTSNAAKTNAATPPYVEIVTANPLAAAPPVQNSNITGQSPMATGVAPQMDIGVAPPMDTGIAPPMDIGVAPPMVTGVAPPMDIVVAPPMDTGMAPPMDIAAASAASPNQNSSMPELSAIDPTRASQMNDPAGSPTAASVVERVNIQLASLAQSVIQALLAQTASGALPRDDPLINAAQVLLLEIQDLTQPRNASSPLIPVIASSANNLFTDPPINTNFSSPLSMSNSTAFDITNTILNSTVFEVLSNATVQDLLNGTNFSLNSTLFGFANITNNAASITTPGMSPTTTTAPTTTVATTTMPPEPAEPTAPPPEPGMPHMFVPLPGEELTEFQAEYNEMREGLIGR